MFWKIKNTIKEFIDERRYRKQRKKNGYAVCDLWGMDYWFSELLPRMLKDMKNRKYAYSELEYEEVNSLPEKFIDNCKEEFLKNFEDIDKFDYVKDGFVREYIIISRIEYCFREYYNWLSKEFELNKYYEEHSKDLDRRFHWDAERDGKHYIEIDEPDTEESKELDKLYNEEQTRLLEHYTKLKNEGLKLFVKYFDYLNY